MRDDVPRLFVGIEVRSVQSMFGIPFNVRLTKGATPVRMDPRAAIVPLERIRPE